MTVARPSRTLEVGAEIGGRYRLTSVLDCDVWGATYQAEDLTDPSLRLVLKQILVPPLRRELDERLAMFGEAMARLHQVRHKSLAPVVDFLKDDHGLYVVMEQVPGTDLASALQSGTGLPPGDSQDIIRIALQLAQGVQALLAAGQHQAISALTPRHVMLVGRGRCALVNFGVGHFLRPFGLTWKLPDPSDDGRERVAFEADFQRQAVRRVGQLLYVLLQRRPWSDSAVLTADALPKDLGPVLLRCLRSGEGGGYDDLAAVTRDLSLLYNVQGLEAWEWHVSETPLPPPPWESMGVSAFALRSTAMGLRSLHAGISRQRTFLKVIAAMLVATLVTWRLLQPEPAEPDVPYVKSGAVVYVACKDGRLQTRDAQSGVRLASRTLDAAPSALGWSARDHRLLVCLPSRNRVVTCDVRTNAWGPKVNMQMGCAELAVSPDGRWAFCTGPPATLLGGINLETMRGTRVVSLPGKCVSMAFSREGQGLFVATDAPPPARGLRCPERGRYGAGPAVGGAAPASREPGRIRDLGPRRGEGDGA